MTKKTLTKDERIERVLRTKQNNPLYLRTLTPVKEYVVKPMSPTALPPSSDLFARGTYRTGDGDVIRALRPGADDHLKFRSKGLRNE